MKKRLLALALALVTAVTLLPIPAQAKIKFDDSGEHRAKYVTWGNNPGAGNYFVYEFDGQRRESDMMGAAYNYHAWLSMSESDKYKVASLYYSKDRREAAFGVEGAQAVVDYVNNKQGWTALYKRLADKIEREYIGGELFQYYSDQVIPGDGRTYYERSWDQLELSDELMLYAYDTEDGRKMRNAQAAAQYALSTGHDMYKKLFEARRLAVEAAVKGISSELISMLVDKVLVPSVSQYHTAVEAWKMSCIDLAQEFISFCGRIATDAKSNKEILDDEEETSAKKANVYIKDLQEKCRAYEKQALRLHDKSVELMSDAILYGQRAKEETEARQAAEERAQKDREFFERWGQDHPADEVTDAQRAYNDLYDALSDIQNEDDVARARERLALLQAQRPAFQKRYDDFIAEVEAWNDTWEPTLAELIENDYPAVTDMELAYCLSGFPDGYGLTPTQYQRRLEALRYYESYANQMKNYIVSHSAKATALFEQESAKYEQFKARQEDIRAALENFNRQVGVLEYYLGDLSAVKFNVDLIYLPCDNGNYELSFRRVKNGYAHWFCPPRPAFSEVATYRIYGGYSYLDAIANECLDPAGTTYYQDEVDRQVARVQGQVDELNASYNDFKDSLRQAVNEFNAARSNYDLAYAYFQESFQADEELLAGLPTYIRSQSYSAMGLANCTGSGNPELFQAIRLAPTEAAREAAAKRYYEQTRDLLRQHERYQARMANAQVRMRECVSAMNAALAVFPYNVTAADFQLTLAGDGVVPNVEQDVWSYNSAHIGMVDAMQFLCQDLCGANPRYQEAVNQCIRELKDNRSRIIREAKGGDRTTLNAIEARYNAARNNALYFSWWGIGLHDNGDDPAFEDLYEQTNAAIADYVNVHSIRKGDPAQAALLETSFELTLAEGESGQLTAIIQPLDATDKTIVWDSLDPEIATVDETGLVTAAVGGGSVLSGGAWDAEAGTLTDAEYGVVTITAHPADSVRMAVDQHGTVLTQLQEDSFEPVVPQGSYIAGYTWRLPDENGDYTEPAELRYTVKVTPRTVADDHPTFTDAEGNALTAIPDGPFRVEVFMPLTPQQAADEVAAPLLLAVYGEEGQMLELARCVEGSRVSLDNGVRAVFDVSAPDAAELKVFLLEDGWGLRPLRGALALPAAG